LETVAFCSADGDDYFEETIREKLARVKMMFDLMLNKQAKIYGDKVEI
jgi:vancomycin permeability regulator SanA